MLYHWRKVFDDKEWTQWRLMLIKILSRLSILKASIAEACKIWFDGNQVMFPDDIEELDQQIEWAQSLAGLYNTIGPRLPTWTEIELAIDTDAIKSDVSRLVRHFVTMARADVLVDDGEVRAARQLVQAQLFATKQAKTH